MSDIGYYTYGIIKDEPIEMSIPGIDKNENIFTVPYNGIACIISRVNLDEFGEVPLKKNLESLDWVRDKVFGHERVIEETMKKTTIVPMKFCTIFSSKGKILGLLKEKYGYFIELLERFANKHEWGVKVYCRKKETVAVKNPGTGREYLMTKKAQEEKAQEEERNVNTYVEEIFGNIRPLAENARINRPTPKELLQGKNKEQVFNASFLVPDRNVEQLTLLMDDLAKMYNKDGLKLELELVGPLPIYSFVGGEKDEYSK